MSFPQGPGNGNNPNPNNNRNNGNPFTNPFNRGNNGNNGKGNKENRPIWQSPWLWGAVLVVMVVLMFQMFAGGGTKTIDTKDGFALINQGKATYAEITDNKQVVRLELKNDYTKKNADTGKVTNYGKNVQFYYTFAQGAQVAKAVENGDLEKGWTSNIEQTSVMSYLITSILPFVIILALFWWLMSRMGGAGGMLGMGGYQFLYWIMLYNVWFAFFNLIPVPPLDGSKVVSMLLPGELSWKFENFNAQYGFIILMVVVFSGVANKFLSPLSNLFVTLCYNITYILL